MMLVGNVASIGPKGRTKRENMLKFGSSPLKAKLPAIMVGIGMIVALMVGFIGYVQISNLAERNLEARVTSLGIEGKASVEQFYAVLTRDMLDMSNEVTRASRFLSARFEI